MRGAIELGSGRFTSANLEFEQALLYNGEDHLTWWLKAVATRLSGEAVDESTDLLNAHYLAPLEPALRAEAFLSQPQGPRNGPSAVLKSLDKLPDDFIEVACHLVEAGLFDQAGRWLDEALLHANLAMLKYLLAYCCLRAGMEADAATQVTSASLAPVVPPYPWRSIEIRVLTDLCDRFPNDLTMHGYLAMAGRHLDLDDCSESE